MAHHSLLLLASIVACIAAATLAAHDHARPHPQRLHHPDGTASTNAQTPEQRLEEDQEEVSETIVYPWRIQDSPYPATSAGPNSTQLPITAFSDTALSSTQLLTIETLQGAVSRTAGAALFRIGSGNATTDQQLQWLQGLQARFGAKVDLSIAANFTALLQRFASNVAGLVTVNVPASSFSSTTSATSPLEVIFGDSEAERERADTSSHHPFESKDNSEAANDNVLVALSLAAALTNDTKAYLVVNASDLALVRAALPAVPSANVIDSSTYTLTSLLGQFKYNSKTMILQDPSKYTFLADYALLAGAFSFFDTMPGAIASKALSTLSGPAVVVGWGPAEGATVDTLSQYGAYIHAADYAPNLAALSAFYVPQLLQRGPRQPLQPSLPLDNMVPVNPGDGSSESRAVPTKKHTVAFLMTDGDNVQVKIFV